jgi:hypothetical protein
VVDVPEGRGDRGTALALRRWLRSASWDDIHALGRRLDAGPGLVALAIVALNSDEEDWVTQIVKRRPILLACAEAEADFLRRLGVAARS